ncbi:hypothetical protein [Bacteroides reticulotermitis]|uniref:Uncharacterized protein n=1 Tax=Bacteroides reticulotermitis JCM 10512 TaxID=1445607 RepID=W4UQS4_9BACE|nr:hypothetical protein [Bacteroides reticulotermitis]GAE83326.1 hypothetical protein JCM10512_1591 [Bacteroides reticulotermitis JCM 10512]
MISPNNKDIEDAKEYLRQRLNAELSIQHNLDVAMDKAAKDVVAISFKYTIPASQFKFSANKDMKLEIDKVLSDLKNQIEDYTETLAVSTHHDDKSNILVYINRDISEKNMTERIEDYTARYGKELEIAIAAGIVMGLSQSKIVSGIKTWRSSPFGNTSILVAEKRGYDLKTRLDVVTTFGVGRTVSSYTALNTLSRNTVAEGWMEYYVGKAIKDGAIGFMSYRGSRYPCQLCDDETAIYISLNWIHIHHITLDAAVI